MTRSFRALCLAAVLAAAPLAHADIDRASAELLVRQSGLWEQLDSVAPQIEAGMRQAMTRARVAPADSEQARIARVIRSAYAADRLRALSAGVIASRVQAEHLDALRAWFDSPLGATVTRAEVTTFRGDRNADAARKEGFRLLAPMPLQRRQLLQDLLDATHAAESMVQVAISTALAVHLGAASATQAGPLPSEARARAVLEAQRPQMLKSFTALTLASFARAYDGLPEDDLRAYIAFVRSPAGADFNDASLHALQAALTDAATQMGQRLPGTRDDSNI